MKNLKLFLEVYLGMALIVVFFTVIFILLYHFIYWKPITFEFIERPTLFQDIRFFATLLLLPTVFTTFMWMVLGKPGDSKK